MLLLFDSSNYFEWYILSDFNSLELSPLPPKKAFLFFFFWKKKKIRSFSFTQHEVEACQSLGWKNPTSFLPYSFEMV